MNFVSILKYSIREVDEDLIMKSSFLNPFEYFTLIYRILEKLTHVSILRYRDFVKDDFPKEKYDMLKIQILRKLLENGLDAQAIFTMALFIYTNPRDGKNRSYVIEFMNDLIDAVGDGSFQNIHRPYSRFNYEDHEGLLNLLLNNGADCNKIVKELFEYPSDNISKDPKIIEILIMRGADVSIHASRLMHDSINLSNIELALNLVGVDVNAENKEGNTPLMSHIQRSFLSNPEIICCLLDHKAEVNCFNHEGDTPLMIIAKDHMNKYFSFVKKAQLLISYGADLYARNPKTGMTAFLYACKKGYPEMMEVLLGDPIYSNDTNKIGKSSLMLICTAKRKLSAVLDGAELLVNHGADLDARNKAGKTVFDYTLRTEIKDFLEKAKAHKLAIAPRSAKKRKQVNRYTSFKEN